MKKTYLKKSVENGIATITIDRPDVLNALNRDLVTELGSLIDELTADRTIRALIITGTGKNFAAGADIADMVELAPSEARAFSFSGVFDKIEGLPIPVFAAIQGYALGGGLELALACDFRICSTTAKLGLPEIKLGIMPGAGGTQRLPKLIGLSRAREMIYFGTIIDAEKALQWGLCDRVVDGDPAEHAKSMAEKLLEKSPIALEAAKKSVNFVNDADMASGIAYEAVVWADLFSTADQKEGMRAFLEKRKPNFTGK
ncbi:MAG TPA: enoyl-CoA hydratase-related protein [Deltaproteobacteria bacterium]|jgi:enoyl-CoA hydratase|nr:enoyl-CoA hydratase-related protein [Deltaproteobacteria bacterium]HPV30707.1 enoyl-CoA hydratase-related protein [Deltaproteobacteria bacterium]HPX51655.1 enoyl-CoA hydratase-related protein [Deltaproteobacteria bacterium]HQA72907.1 enoyl-CoA hydratase-related protein [Deltaproteobacteria bacterium]